MSAMREKGVPYSPEEKAGIPMPPAPEREGYKPIQQPTVTAQQEIIFSSGARYKPTTGVYTDPTGLKYSMAEAQLSAQERAEMGMTRMPSGWKPSGTEVLGPRGGVTLIPERYEKVKAEEEEWQRIQALPPAKREFELAKKGVYKQPFTGEFFKVETKVVEPSLTPRKLTEQEKKAKALAATPMFGAAYTITRWADIWGLGGEWAPITLGRYALGHAYPKQFGYPQKVRKETQIAMEMKAAEMLLDPKTAIIKEMAFGGIGAATWAFPYGKVISGLGGKIVSPTARTVIKGVGYGIGAGLVGIGTRETVLGHFEAVKGGYKGLGRMTTGITLGVAGAGLVYGAHKITTKPKPPPKPEISAELTASKTRGVMVEDMRKMDLSTEIKGKIIYGKEKLPISADVTGTAFTKHKMGIQTWDIKTPEKGTWNWLRGKLGITQKMKTVGGTGPFYYKVTQKGFKFESTFAGWKQIPEFGPVKYTEPLLSKSWGQITSTWQGKPYTTIHKTFKLTKGGIGISFGQTGVEYVSRTFQTRPIVWQSAEWKGGQWNILGELVATPAKGPKGGYTPLAKHFPPPSKPPDYFPSVSQHLKTLKLGKGESIVSGFVGLGKKRIVSEVSKTFVIPKPPATKIFSIVFPLVSTRQVTRKKVKQTRVQKLERITMPSFAPSLKVSRLVAPRLVTPRKERLQVSMPKMISLQRQPSKLMTLQMSVQRIEKVQRLKQLQRLDQLVAPTITPPSITPITRTPLRQTKKENQKREEEEEIPAKSGSNRLGEVWQGQEGSCFYWGRDVPPHSNKLWFRKKKKEGEKYRKKTKEEEKEKEEEIVSEEGYP